MSKSVYDMVKDYESSNGYLLHQFFIQIEYTRYAFDDNYRELQNLIIKFEKETSTRQKNTDFIQVEMTRRKMKGYRKKFIRHLLNFTSSAYALEENYKSFFSRDTNYDVGIWNDFKSILLVPERLFVFALRTHISHYKALNISTGINHTKSSLSEPEFFIITQGCFSISKLALSNDLSKAMWGEKRSEYMNKEDWQPDLANYVRKFKGLSIDLKNPLEDYYNIFTRHIDVINQEVLSKYEEIYDQANNLHKEIIRKQSKIK